MSNEAKLRALLAEAREGLFDEDVFHDVARCPCRFCGLARRIDAALAEPVDAVKQDPAPHNSASLADLRYWCDTAHELGRERDEALAEVARLKAHGIAELETVLLEMANERDAARAELERLKVLYIDARVDGFKDGRAAAQRELEGKP